MRVLPILAACIAVGLAAGCTSLPPVDDAVAQALRDPDSPHRLALLRRQGELATGVPFTAGNRVTLLRDGAGTLPAIIAAIDGARSAIDMESYVFDEREGLDIADRLVARASAGIEVNLIYDAWGSLATSNALLSRLREAGVHVLEFNPIGPKSLLADLANHRDHRKILVVDGRLAITGGVNISGVYLRPSAEPGAKNDPQHDSWRDTDIRIEGPAVADYERSFRQTWSEHRGAPMAPRPLPSPAEHGEQQVQVITNSPSHHDHDIYRSLLVAIALARKSIHLTTGFFVPTHDLREALGAAARRGVDVRLLVPRNRTSKLAVEAGRGYYADLLEDGVHIFEYPSDRVLHAKTAVIDGDWSTVGSSNLDWRSVVLNDELTTVILGPAFGTRMETMFAADTALAAEVDAGRWAQRPLTERLREWHARLFEYFL
ncbi:MAG: phospholipase D-like domain-containing protein [Nevskia sp.]